MEVKSFNSRVGECREEERTSDKCGDELALCVRGDKVKDFI